MRARLSLAVVAGLMALSLGAGSVAAANARNPFRASPAAFGLVSTADFSAVANLDHNNDGWLCALYSPLPAPAQTGDYIVIDNTTP